MCWVPSSGSAKAGSYKESLRTPPGTLPFRKDPYFVSRWITREAEQFTQFPVAEPVTG